MVNTQQQQFAAALAMIRKQLNNERIYNTWFGCLQLESYDPAQKMLLVQVPSKYVYEYLEQYGAKILSWALKANFGDGVRLQYRAMTEPTYTDMAEYMRSQGLNLGNGIPHIQRPNARQLLEEGLRQELKKLDGREPQWLPGYDMVVSWLQDNHRRGLLCFGTPGTGKSLLCAHVLPNIIGIQDTVVVTAQEMTLYDNKAREWRVDQLLRKRCVVIDGLAPEHAVAKNYSTTRRPFFELCDAALQRGILLVITTSLYTVPTRDPRYLSSIEEAFGDDVLNRLRSVTHTALFDGKPMWKPAASPCAATHA